MNFYLNNKTSYENFKDLLNSEYKIDKTNIISILNKRINSKQKYICITKPRRFGKTSIIDMLGAYYKKILDTKKLFDKLNISNCNTYQKNINKYNVIRIDFSSFPDDCRGYEDYINMIKNTIKNDIKNSYEKLRNKEFENIERLLEATNDKFIFIFDEWDFIFNRNKFIDYHEDYLDFLRNLLKDKSYVYLCYMTGILPIKKHSTASSLNMFEEYTFLKDKVFEEYFGFTENEVKFLSNQNNKLSYENLESWYNGYTTSSGFKIYNPRSVILALLSNDCQSYWTNTGKIDEVLEYLKYDIYGVRNDVIKMINGEEIDIDIKEEFRAGQKEPQTIEEIYSAMIVLGFLSYYENSIKIPNKELMLEFRKALRDESFGEVSKIVNNSKDMLKATQNEDCQTIVDILHQIHNSEIPVLKYNDENSLSCVVTLAYLSARDTYRIEREEKSGRDVLIVAICYNSKSKEHTCKIEKI